MDCVLRTWVDRFCRTWTPEQWLDSWFLIQTCNQILLDMDSGLILLDMDRVLDFILDMDSKLIQTRLDCDLIFLAMTAY